MLSPIITLNLCKNYRENACGITYKQLAAITRIPLDRVAALESKSKDKACEPWLDEAVLIAQALGMATIVPLISTLSLREIDTGFDVQDDLDVWRTGCRLPLRFGLRLALRFGFADPIHLVPPQPVYREIWRIAGEERNNACPWCKAPIVGEQGHLPTCLPALLYGARDAPISTIGVMPKPRRPHTRREGSRLAPGLAPLRARLGLTQEEFANEIGKHPQYYARLEQLRDPLTQDLAEKIGALFKVPLTEVYIPETLPPVPHRNVRSSDDVGGAA